MTVVANVSFSLSCAAHGPPDPVKVIWLQDGAPLNTLEDHLALSPSTLNLTGNLYLIHLEDRRVRTRSQFFPGVYFNVNQIEPLQTESPL